jgi:hypothetical protein
MLSYADIPKERKLTSFRSSTVKFSAFRNNLPTKQLHKFLFYSERNLRVKNVYHKETTVGKS